MTGVELIAAERERQISVEGFTPEHDDEHNMGELAAAAMCYAETSVDEEIAMASFRGEFVHQWWPWDMRWWKADDRMRNLVKAGALIAAEIDRLQRGTANEANADQAQDASAGEATGAA